MQLSDPWFLLCFLPACLLGFYVIGRISRSAAVGFLAAASIAFYAVAGVLAACVILGAAAVNLVIGRAMLATESAGRRKALLWGGVAANVALLAYFKYTGFLLMNVAVLTGGAWRASAVMLPLGISFSTFQRIALLVDVHRGKVKDLPWLDYALFSVFFPCAVAGPITRGQEMLPQFRELRARFSSEGFAEGLSIFVVGLAKKVLIADSLQAVSSQVFDGYAIGTHGDALTAWVGVIAYSLQIYYDFSGYSEMALGLARMVGLRLPVNFNSPYKANSITGFWNRWHITLSRFLRDYLFTPMSGGHSFLPRRYAALMATMLIAGLWHGAQWRFVVWGGLHGALLVANHAWRELAGRYPAAFARVSSKRMRPLGQGITFLSVTVAWVFFRAADMATAGSMIKSLAGVGCPFLHMGAEGVRQYFVPVAGVAIVLVYTLWAPGTIAIFSKAGPFIESMPVIRTRWRWVPTWRSAAVIGMLAFLVFRAYFAATEFVGFTYANF